MTPIDPAGPSRGLRGIRPPEGWKSYWPILPPVLVSAVELVALHNLTLGDWGADPHPALAAGASATAGSLWLATTTALFVLSFALAVATCVLVLRDSAAGRAWKSHIAVFALLIVLFPIAVKVLGGFKPTESYLGEGAFLGTVGPVWAHGDWCGVARILASPERPECGLNELSVLVTGTTVLAFVAVFLAAIAVASLAAYLRSEATISSLARCMASMKALLLAASFVLVSGILFVKAWTELPLAIAADAKDGNAAFIAQFKSVALSFQLFQAVWYVALIAALFVPMGLALTFRARRLAQQDVGDVAVDKWLDERGLSLSIFERLQSFAAVLAPLFAGPLVDVIKAASSH